MSISEGIYIGKLTHQRSYPKAHHFQYKHVMLALDVDSNKTSSFIFGLNKFRILSIYAKNHLGGEKTNFRTALNKLLKYNAKYNKNNQMIVLTTPSVLGHVFNPATFFFQLDKEKKELELAIVEVNNTFGEAHTYVLDKQKLDKTVSVFFNKKEFHVSPFADMQGHYKFKFDLNENQINISIHLIKNDTPIITANFNGYKTNFANSTLLKSLIKIVTIAYFTEFRILSQAFRLMIIKKLKFYQKPEPQNQNTYISSSPSYINKMKFIKWIKKFKK